MIVAGFDEVLLVVLLRSAVWFWVDRVCIQGSKGCLIQHNLKLCYPLLFVDQGYLRSS